MPVYSIIAEVVQTRSYTVHANDANEAEDLLRSQFEIIEFDVLEEDIETTEVEEVNG